jgi:hypothetical protein
MAGVRTHKHKIEMQRGNLSQEALRQITNTRRCHSGLARKKINKERAEKRVKRRPSVQLHLLDCRLGEGDGAARERARLNKKVMALITEEGGSDPKKSA